MIALLSMCRWQFSRGNYAAQNYNPAFKRLLAFLAVSYGIHEHRRFLCSCLSTITCPFGHTSLWAMASRTPETSTQSNMRAKLRNEASPRICPNAYPLLTYAVSNCLMSPSLICQGLCAWARPQTWLQDGTLFHYSTDT